MKKQILLLLIFIAFLSYGENDSVAADKAAEEVSIELESADEGDTEVAIELEVEAEISDSIEIETTSGDSIQQEALPEIEKMPEFLKTVEPDYPQEVYSQGIEGAVLVNMIVSDSGTVDSVWLEKGIHPVLDTNVLNAAKEFTFTPAVAGGENVAVMIQYEKLFTLKEIVNKVEKYVNFSGRIREKGTRKPIADAMVVLSFLDTTFDNTLGVPFKTYFDKIGSFEGQYIEDDKLVTLTDSVGGFSFTSLPAGPVEIKFPLPGYEVLTENEQIISGELLEVDYMIQKVSYSEFEVVVYGKKETKEVTRHKLTINEVKKIPGLGGDAVKVVQALPGVARPTLGLAEIVVRGSNTEDSKYYLDGVEIPLLFHFGGIKSTYNSDALESVDFYPGGFGSRYGGAIGGVIEITGRQPKKDRVHGYVDLNFYDGSAMIEGPVNEKISVMGEFRRSFIGDIIKGVASASPSASILTTAPTYWDYLVRADLDLNERVHSYVTLFGVKDKMEMISSDVRGGSEDIDKATDAFYMELLFHMGIWGLDWKINDRLKNVLRYSFLYGEDVVSAFGFFKSEDSYFQHTIRNQLEARISEKLQINLGADMQYFPLDLMLTIPSGKNTFERDTTNDWMFGVVAAYLNMEIKPNKKLQIIPGIRYDYFPELNYDGAIIPEYFDYDNIENKGKFSGEPSLRVNTKYEFVKKHFIKTALGNYSQTPKPVGQTIHPTWGNPRLEASRAAHYVLGYEWKITDLVHVDIEGYYNRQWNMPYYSVDPNSPTLYTNKGKERMKGIEMLLRHDQGERFFGWISYSLSKSEHYNYEEKKWVRFTKDQTHNLIALGSWKLPKNWEVGFKFQYATGDLETPIIGAEKVMDGTAGYWKTIEGPENSERLNPTAQLDIRIDKKVILKKMLLSAYIDFFNIGYFLYKSPQMYVYNSDYPWDEVNNEPNRQAVNQYSIFSIGLRAEF